MMGEVPGKSEYTKKAKGKGFPHPPQQMHNMLKLFF